jgi:hypothetical protein
VSARAKKIVEDDENVTDENVTDEAEKDETVAPETYNITSFGADYDLVSTTWVAAAVGTWVVHS